MNTMASSTQIFLNFRPGIFFYKKLKTERGILKLINCVMNYNLEFSFRECTYYFFSRFCDKHGTVDTSESKTPPPDLLYVAELMAPRIFLRLILHLRNYK